MPCIGEAQRHMVDKAVTYLRCTARLHRAMLWLRQHEGPACTYKTVYRPCTRVARIGIQVYASMVIVISTGCNRNQLVLQQCSPELESH